MFCLVFLPGLIAYVAELMARLCTVHLVEQKLPKTVQYMILLQVPLF